MAKDKEDSEKDKDGKDKSKHSKEKDNDDKDKVIVSKQNEEDDKDKDDNDKNKNKDKKEKNKDGEDKDEDQKDDHKGRHKDHKHKDHKDKAKGPKDVDADQKDNGDKYKDSKNVDEDHKENDDKEKDNKDKHKGPKHKDKDKEDEVKKEEKEGDDKKESTTEEKETEKGKKGRRHKKKSKTSKVPEVIVETEPALNFNKRLRRALQPMRQVLILTGRYPFTSTMNSNTSYTYLYTKKTFGKVYFYFVTIMTFYILIIGTINIVWVLQENDFDYNYISKNISLNSTNENPITNTTDFSMSINLTSYKIPKINRTAFINLFEKVLFERHIVSIIVIWVSLIHNAIVSISIIVRGKYMAAYFSSWTRDILAMHMDLGKALFTYCFKITVIFITLICGLTCMAILGFGPTTRGTPVLLGVLMLPPPLRLFHINIFHLKGIDENTFFVLQIMTGVILMFILVSSKAYVLYFLAHCKLLRNAFGIWNGRVYASVLRGGGDFAQTPEGRTTYKLLYKDHCVLVDQMEGTNKVFSYIIESYYGLQFFSLCFEIYFFLRTCTNGGVASQNDAARHFYFIREFDFIPGLIVLTMNVWVILIISQAAAEVGEESIAGLEVLRRKTMLGRKTDEELYFMLSMYASYTAHKSIQVCGGGYMYFNKEFIIFIIATISSYFIIIYQFQPPLDLIIEDEQEHYKKITRELIGRFIEGIENWNKQGNCHWTINAANKICKMYTDIFDEL